VAGGFTGGNHLRVPGQPGGNKVEIVCPECQAEDRVDEFDPRDPHVCKRHAPPVPMVLVPKKKPR
jgi:hypothetical protein